MDSYKVDTLVLGATYAGLGYAAKHTNTVVIEEGELLGSDFSQTFKPVASKSNPSIKAGETLHDFLKLHAVIDETNRIDRLRLTTVISRYVDQLQMRILLNAQLMDISKDEAGTFVVKVYTNNGIRVFQAEKILDTTQKPKSDQCEMLPVRKNLHVLTSDVDQETIFTLVGNEKNIKITPAYLPNEWTVSFQFDPDTDIMAARAYIEEYWKKTCVSSAVLIDAIAFEFETVYEVDNDFASTHWIAPQQFSNPIEAFEAGYSFVDIV